MTESVELTVNGIKCGGCETNIKTKLNSIEGVVTVTASSKDKKVNVEYDLDKTGPDAIKAALAEIGYPAD